MLLKRLVKKASFVSIVTGVFLFFCSSLVIALDTIKPYVEAKVEKDNNLFRVADDNEALSIIGTTDKDDTIKHLIFGVNSAVPISRQKILVKARVDRALYDNFTTLDHTGVNGKVDWKWVIGNQWKGSLFYGYRRSLIKFQESTEAQKDMRTKSRMGFRAEYQLHPRWSVLAGVGWADHEQEKRPEKNRTQKSLSLEGRYATTEKTRVGIRVVTDYGSFERNENIDGSLINNDYTENEFSGVVYWKGTSKSQFQGRLGFTQRSHEELPERDFSGTTGRLSYRWLLTAKTIFDFDLWRETRIRPELSAFVETDGISAKGTWQVTQKMALIGGLLFEKDKFTGSADTVVSASSLREDKNNSWHVSASYKMFEFMTLKLSFRDLTRDSNFESNDYSADIVQIGMKFIF